MAASKKLRIAFNTSCLYPNAFGGWARYTRSLIDALNENHSNEVEIVELWNQSGKTHTLWEQFELPKRIKELSIDIFHAPAQGGVPVLTHIPTVLTVHDLFSEDDFKWSNQLKSARLLKEALRYKIDWKLSLHFADKIIAVSEFTKNQLIKGVPSDKIKVVLEGVSTSIEQTAKNFRNLMPRSYVVYVGTGAPRKRVQQLIEQFLKSNSNLKLVLVGASQISSDHPSVIHFPYLKDEELSAAYSNALAFVTFSEKEGFGLPLVEAMACATPVVYTGGGAIGEVVGNGGFKIAESEFSVALQRLQGDTKNYEALRASSLSQAKKFSWKTCAKETLDCYRSLRISSANR